MALNPSSPTYENGKGFIHVKLPSMFSKIISFIFLCILLHSNAVNTSPLLRPTFKVNEFIDYGTQILVHTQDDDEQFLFVFCRWPEFTPTIFYVSHDGGINFISLKLSYAGKDIRVHRCGSAQGYLICRSKNIEYYYINKKPQIDYILEYADLSIDVHNKLPENVIKIDKVDKSVIPTIPSILYISNDYGQSFKRFFEDAKFAHWVEDTLLLVALGNNKTLIIYDPMENTYLSIIHNCDIYLVSGTALLVVFPDRARNLVIYNWETKSSMSVKVQSSSAIQDIFMFEHIHNQYYIVVVDEDNDVCLYGLDATLNYFHKLLCNLDDPNYQFNPVYFHPHIPGVIYANILHTYNTYYSHISIDNGRSFTLMKLAKSTHDCKVLECYFKLQFGNSVKDTDLNTPTPWLSIFDGNYLEGGRYKLISNDGGFNWKFFANERTWWAILNNGGVIARVTDIGGEISYSYNYGNTWNKDIIYSTKVMIDQFIRNGKYEREYAFVVAKNGSRIFLISLTFSHVFNRVCMDADYDLWQIKNPEKHDIQEIGLFYLRKKSEALCIDKNNPAVPYMPSQ